MSKFRHPAINSVICLTANQHALYSLHVIFRPIRELYREHVTFSLRTVTIFQQLEPVFLCSISFLIILISGGRGKQETLPLIIINFDNIVLVANRAAGFYRLICCGPVENVALQRGEVFFKRSSSKIAMPTLYLHAVSNCKAVLVLNISL